jgi:hypothetical protein
MDHFCPFLYVKDRRSLPHTTKSTKGHEEKQGRKTSALRMIADVVRSLHGGKLAMALVPFFLLPFFVCLRALRAFVVRCIRR